MTYNISRVPGGTDPSGAAPGKSRQHRPPSQFDILMVENRSDIPGPMKWLLLVWLGGSAIMAIYFIWRGAWPASLYLLAAAYALYCALESFGRHAPARESLRFTGSEIHHMATDRRGNVQARMVPQRYARLELRGASEICPVLRLRYGGRTLTIGRCLSATEKTEIARLIARVIETGRD